MTYTSVPLYDTSNRIIYPGAIFLTRGTKVGQTSSEQCIRSNIREGECLRWKRARDVFYRLHRPGNSSILNPLRIRFDRTALNTIQYLCGSPDSQFLVRRMHAAGDSLGRWWHAPPPPFTSESTCQPPVCPSAGHRWPLEILLCPA
ncbi:hypothetical protein J6590_038810 [Homalodisca vitripennis]|nr:hypothetical protein J6590_038810 [Homalodisca vitripennis]